MLLSGTSTRSAPAGRRPPKPSHQVHTFMKKNSRSFSPAFSPPFPETETAECHTRKELSAIECHRLVQLSVKQDFALRPVFHNSSKLAKKDGSPKCWKNTDHISLWILEMPKCRCRSAAIFSVPVWYWISARSLLKSDFTPDVNRADFQHGRYPWMLEHITRTIGSCVAVSTSGC